MLPFCTVTPVITFWITRSFVAFNKMTVESDLEFLLYILAGTLTELTHQNKSWAESNPVSKVVKGAFK